MLQVRGDVYLMGDMHGKGNEFVQKLKKRGVRNSTIICVGDIGAGYPGYGETWLCSLAEKLRQQGNRLIAIRGNHDDPAFFNKVRTFKENVTLVPDYTYADVNGEKWLLVGGATSVDRSTSIPGISWWADEVFVLDHSKITPVDVLVTHTGPRWIGPAGKNGIVLFYDTREEGRLWPELLVERNKMDELYRHAKAKRAYLGHFHESSVATYDGCHAKILNELEIVQHFSE